MCCECMLIYLVFILFIMIFIHYIYKYTPTYRPPPFSNPTHETKDQIGMALINLRSPPDITN